MERVIGRKVILHNHKNKTGVITFFQGNKKPIVAELLDENEMPIYEYVGTVKRKKKVVTANWSWFKIN
jgi:hypothetical protein